MYEEQMEINLDGNEQLKIDFDEVNESNTKMYGTGESHSSTAKASKELKEEIFTEARKTVEKGNNEISRTSIYLSRPKKHDANHDMTK